MFIGNHAINNGGALMLRSESLKEDLNGFIIYYNKCFFKNEMLLPVTEWNVSTKLPPTD